jgi:hypothetical protein
MVEEETVDGSSTELEPRPELLNPVSGELVPVADLPAVAKALREIRELRDQLNGAVAAFSEAVIAASRAQGTRTLHAGGVELKVSADSAVEWDITMLARLPELGLPEERYNELVTEIVSYKVNNSVARQLAGANPSYKQVIEAAKGRIPTKQYVSITRT